MSVHLLSSDNEEFKVDKDVAERSVLIKNMLEGNKRKVFIISIISLLFINCIFIDIGDSDAPIPLPNVTSKVLGKVTFIDNQVMNNIINSCNRSLNGVLIIVKTLLLKMIKKDVIPISKNGTKNTWKLIKRPYLISFW